VTLPAHIKTSFDAAVFALMAVCSFFVCAPSASAVPLILKPDTEGLLWSTGLKSLLFAVVLLAAVYWILKRSKGRLNLPAQKNINLPTVLGSKRISTRSTLLVIGWQGRSYLLVEQNGSTQVIDSRDQTEMPI